MEPLTRDITDRLGELRNLRPDVSTEEFQTWKRKTRIDLCQIVGEHDHHVREFDHIRFTPAVGYSMSEAERNRHCRESFEDGRARAAGLLNGVLHLAEAAPSAKVGASLVCAPGSIDADLAEHLRNLLRDEDWSKLPTQTVVFVEGTVRQWAELSLDVIGKDLWVQVLHPDTGKYPLGETPGEKQGWLQLGIGFSSALRNPNVHRIGERQDAKTYALGVVGVASLLLTQLKYQHSESIRRAGQRPEEATRGDWGSFL